jgi:hypothetical protein
MGHKDTTYIIFDGDKDLNDFLVELIPGLIKLKNGGFRPENGYRWVNANDQKDLRVVPSLGMYER